MGKGSRIALLHTIKGSADSLPQVPQTRQTSHRFSCPPLVRSGQAGHEELWGLPQTGHKCLGEGLLLAQLRQLHLRRHQPWHLDSNCHRGGFGEKVVVSLRRPEGSGREGTAARTCSQLGTTRLVLPDMGGGFGCRLPIPGVSQGPL